MRDSHVRTYSRKWPTSFVSGNGSLLRSDTGRIYLDLFSAAGSLNYGHNPPQLVQAAIDYLRSGGVVNSLDMDTPAKSEFFAALDSVVSARSLPYEVVQLSGPSGASSVEAAVRLARICTGRQGIVRLRGSYHGATAGVASISDGTGRGVYPCGVALTLPHPMEVGEDQVLSQLISYLDDGRVAGVVVETVQGEGGVRPISSGFLQQAARLIQSAGSLLIVDDVQAGCGRTGNFFSFEDLDVVPDMVCLSKSLSGIGFPLGVVLLKGGVDCWEPGEYTGTFRGAGLSFVTAACALRTWWEDDSFSNLVKERGRLLRIRLEEALVGTRLHVRGRGMFLGIVGEPGDGADLSRRMFDLRVVAESCGADEEVLKLLPSLNASPEFIEEFLGILKTVVVDFT